MQLLPLTQHVRDAAQKTLTMRWLRMTATLGGTPELGGCLRLPFLDFLVDLAFFDDGRKNDPSAWTSVSESLAGSGQIIRQDHKLQFFKGCLRSSGQVLDKFLLLHMCYDRTVVRYQVQQASTQISRAIVLEAGERSQDVALTTQP